MPAFSIKVIVLDSAPTDPDKAREISQLLTRDFGSVGWEPVTAYPIGRSKLVVLLKQPAA